MNTAAFLIAIIASFLLGSIPTGYILVRISDGRDIRKLGSGNTGSTNVLRNSGRGLALATQACDFLKGFIPVWLALHQFGDPDMGTLTVLLSGLAAIMGHDFSPFLGFTGSKGVNTTVGAVAAISPITGLVALVVFAISSRISGYVSVASILTGLAIPLVYASLGGSPLTTSFFTAYGILIVIRHKANIARLMKGTESRRP